MVKGRHVKIHPSLYEEVKKIQLSIFQETGAEISFTEASKILANKQRRGKADPFDYGLR